jgi:hypothetical protein
MIMIRSILFNWRCASAGSFQLLITSNLNEFISLLTWNLPFVRDILCDINARCRGPVAHTGVVIDMETAWKELKKHQNLYISMGKI